MDKFSFQTALAQKDRHQLCPGISHLRDEIERYDRSSHHSIILRLCLPFQLFQFLCGKKTASIIRKSTPAASSAFPDGGDTTIQKMQTGDKNCVKPDVRNWTW